VSHTASEVLRDHIHLTISLPDVGSNLAVGISLAGTAEISIFVVSNVSLEVLQKSVAALDFLRERLSGEIVVVLGVEFCGDELLGVTRLGFLVVSPLGVDNIATNSIALLR